MSRSSTQKRPARLTLRIAFDGSRALGPGKIRLLELIGELGSISAAGRAMRMSYPRAWQLIDSLNRTFARPLVSVRHGGRRGGGARLTPFGRRVVGDYRAIESGARHLAAARLERLGRAIMRGQGRRASAPR